MTLGVAVENSADQRSRFVDRAEPRVTIEESAGHVVGSVVEHIADQFSWTFTPIVVPNLSTLLDAGFATGVSECRFDNRQLAALPAATFGRDGLVLLDAHLAFFGIVEAVFVEVVVFKGHGRVGNFSIERMPRVERMAKSVRWAGDVWYHGGMNSPELTTSQEQALSQNHGFVQGSSYVLMSVNVYRELMGVGSDADLADSLQAIDEAMQDAAAGRTLSLDEARRKLDEKYGVHD